MDDLILKIGKLKLNEINNIDNTDINNIISDMKNLKITKFKNINNNNDIDIDSLSKDIKNIKINEIENNKFIEINDNYGSKFIFLLNDKLEYLKHNPPFSPTYIDAF